MAKQNLILSQLNNSLILLIAGEIKVLLKFCANCLPPALLLLTPCIKPLIKSLPYCIQTLDGELMPSIFLNDSLRVRATFSDDPFN